MSTHPSPERRRSREVGCGSSVRYYLMGRSPLFSPLRSPFLLSFFVFVSYGVRDRVMMYCCTAAVLCLSTVNKDARAKTACTCNRALGSCCWHREGWLHTLGTFAALRVVHNNLHGWTVSRVNSTTSRAGSCT